MRRNITYYQKIKSNPSLAYILQSALSNIFNELSHAVTENSCVKNKNNSNGKNSQNNDDSNNFNNINNYDYNKDESFSPKSKDISSENPSDNKNVTGPAQ